MPNLERGKTARVAIAGAAAVATAAILANGMRGGETPTPIKNAGGTSQGPTTEPSAGATQSPDNKIGNENHVGLTRVADNLWVVGVPTTATNVEKAKVVQTIDYNHLQGQFQNDLGDGTQIMFAEPGKLDVGPDFPKSQVDAAGGTIEYFNPLNQEVLSDEVTPWNLRGGGLAMVSTNGATIQIGDKTIRMDSVPNTNWLFFVRGQYADSDQNTDENKKMMITVDHPGFGEVRSYSGNPNGGFISQGQLEQLMTTSHSGGTNCGDAGCSDLNIVMYDVNTGALVMVKQVAGQNQSNFDVTPVYSNVS